MWAKRAPQHPRPRRPRRRTMSPLPALTRGNDGSNSCNFSHIRDAFHYESRGPNEHITRCLSFGLRGGIGADPEAAQRRIVFARRPDFLAPGIVPRVYGQNPPSTMIALYKFEPGHNRDSVGLH